MVISNFQENWNYAPVRNIRIIERARQQWTVPWLEFVNTLVLVGTKEKIIGIFVVADAVLKTSEGTLQT